MHWMWGPIQEDNLDMDLEKDGEASLSEEQEPNPADQLGGCGGNLPLQNYQAHLMFLEQQRAKRLRMAWLEQDMMKMPRGQDGSRGQAGPSMRQNASTIQSTTLPNTPPTEAPKVPHQARTRPDQVQVEFPQTATSAPHTEFYETKSKAIAALYDYKLGELSNFCTFDPKTNTIVAIAIEASIPSPATLREATLEVLWLPMKNMRSER